MKTKNLALLGVSAATLGALFGASATQASALEPAIKSLMTQSANLPGRYVQSNNDRADDVVSTDKPPALAALAETVF